MGVVVLGTGRSGTSAIARAFVFAGYFAGDKENLAGANPSNPLGHYESRAILSLNEELLRDFGCGWWAGMPDKAEQEARRPELLPRLRKALSTIVAAAEGAPVILKEPRINPLLPLWQPVLDSALHPVLAVRDPLEVAASLARRDGTPFSHGLAAWEAHLTLVLDLFHGRDVTVAPYPAIATDAKMAEAIVEESGAWLRAPLVHAVRPADAAAAFDPDLHHERAGDSHEEHLTVHQLRLWEYLSSLPAGSARLEAPAAVRSPSEAARAAIRREGELVSLARRAKVQETRLREAADLIAALQQRARLAEERTCEVGKQAADAVRREAEAQAREGSAVTSLARYREEVESGLSWKVTAPLRAVRRGLAQRRH